MYLIGRFNVYYVIRSEAQYLFINTNIQDTLVTNLTGTPIYFLLIKVTSRLDSIYWKYS
jgi:hypothetical protein